MRQKARKELTQLGSSPNTAFPIKHLLFSSVKGTNNVFFFFFKKKKVESEMECLVEEKVCEGERKLGFFLSHNFVFLL